MPVRPRADNPLVSAFFPRADNHWRMSVATLASVVMSWPLILHGTPDVESYSMSIFSTVAFVRNLVAGTDPWFVPGYGFGIPLPNSNWLIKFPPALPAALLGADVLYAVVWLGGGFLFALFFLRLCGALTRHRGVAAVLLLTALLSFSNLGSTFVNDWPAHFLGWALLPACLWSMLRTLTSETGRQAIRRGAGCCVVLGIFVGSSHHNEMLTFFSGMAVLLALFIRKRPLGVLAVGIAMVVAVSSALDVMVPTIQGLRGGGLNPLVAPIESTSEALSVRSYGIFLEPARTVAAGGLDRALAPGYERVPFFGLVGLALALIGAVYPFRTRDPVNRMPNDVARGIAMGFVIFSALTLLPGWIVLNLPAMWMYRDGQTVFGLLCAAMALPRLLETVSRPAAIAAGGAHAADQPGRGAARSPCRPGRKRSAIWLRQAGACAVRRFAGGGRGWSGPGPARGKAGGGRSRRSRRVRDHRRHRFPVGRIVPGERVVSGGDDADAGVCNLTREIRHV